MSTKTLFIDAQVFQSAAWDRGMGKYSLALLKTAMQQKNYNYDHTYLIFTKNLPLVSEARQLIKAAAPKAEHIFVDLQAPFDPCQADIPKLQTINEGTLNELIAQKTGDQSERPDYLVLSLFVDQVCSVFPTGCRRVLLAYDLIPFQYSERYGKLCTFPNHLARYKTLFEADLILTISQTVADDIAVYLGIPVSKIVNIDGAPIERKVLKPAKPKLKLPARYVLMPSGNDLRKNNIRAVQGFEEYCRNANDTNLRLIITSFFDARTIENLKRYSPNLIFSGNVSEAELSWLYQHCEALLFVPEYEGLGLPILEAAESKKPIVCSNLTVFNEMSSSAFYYSDPHDSLSIAKSLAAALDGLGLAPKIAEYKTILERYSWANTGHKAVTALEKPAQDQNNHPRLRLAIFAPNPSGYSDIGKRVLQLHPAMQAYFDIDYYLEDGKTQNSFSRPSYLPHIARVYPAVKFTRKKYREYDAVLYHVGNSEFHLETIKNALYLPGYAVFHDTFLTNVFEGELQAYGYISKQRFEAEKELDTLLDNRLTGFLTSLANAQQAIMVHSDYARQAIEAALVHDIPVAKTNLPIAVPKQLKSRLGDAKLTIGFAGIIHPAKGLNIIEDVAKAEEFHNCNIHIFGLSLVSDEVIKNLESYPNVTVDTNVTDFQFQTMLSEVDVLINFRQDYRGETSAATLETMRFGGTPIVRKIGWYDELPDKYVKKVHKAAEVITCLKQLVQENEEVHRQPVGNEARQYLEQNFSYEAYAKKVYETITQERAQNTNDKINAALKNKAGKGKLKQIIRKSDNS